MIPPPMPPPYQMPLMPQLQIPPPPHLQMPWASPAQHPAPRPLVAPIPAPYYAFQQPGLGLRQDGRRAVPPHIDHQSQGRLPHGIVNHAVDFRVRGQQTSLKNPFALAFAGNLRDVTSGGHGDPVGKNNYASICGSMRALAHKNACSRWLAFGMCREPNCEKLHVNWPVEMNGEVLNSKYRDLAHLAGVPQDWQPAGRGQQWRQRRGTAATGPSPLEAQQPKTDHSGDVQTEHGHRRRCGEVSNVPTTTQDTAVRYGESMHNISASEPTSVTVTTTQHDPRRDQHDPLAPASEGRYHTRGEANTIHLRR